MVRKKIKKVDYKWFRCLPPRRISFSSKGVEEMEERVTGLTTKTLHEFFFYTEEEKESEEAEGFLLISDNEDAKRRFEIAWNESVK